MFPDDPHDIAIWPQCLRYLDQAQVCHALIEQYMLPFIEAASLLNRTGLYLYKHALYAIAEPLYQRALAICEQQLGADASRYGYQPQQSSSPLPSARQVRPKRSRYMQRALAIREQQLGASASRHSSKPQQPGGPLKHKGSMRKRSRCIERALAIREQQLGPSTPTRRPASTIWQHSTRPGQVCRSRAVVPACPGDL